MNRYDKLLQVQQRCLDALAHEQASTTLNTLRRSREKQLPVLVFSNIITVYFATGHLSDLPLMIMCGIMVLLNAIGMAGIIWQLQVLQQQEYWEKLPWEQRRIGLMQTAVLLQSLKVRFTRIRILALPFCSVYLVIALSFMGRDTGTTFLISTAALLLPVSIWLYFKVKSLNYMKLFSRFL